jgi:7-carboxy-7-deazaguanine synthase
MVIMLVNEIFSSIQGEGQYMGIPMVFVRLTGCNLRCSWCDTKYAYHEGENYTVQRLINELAKLKIRDLCLTGGEPLVQDETPKLISDLVGLGYTIYLETNGSLDIGNLPKSDRVKISLDIKCPSSGEVNKMNFSNIEQLNAGDQIKFIIADMNDYEYAKKILFEYITEPNYEIIFTPCQQNRDKTSEQIDLTKLADLVLRDGLRVRVLPQLHKLIWPNEERSV